jgi:hypothetical protein
MDVDPAPRSTTTQLEEEEKKSEETMAHEGIVPPVVSHESEKEAVVPQAEGNTIKEKALVAESQKAAEGVPASKNDGQSSSSKKSALEKSRKPRAPLKPIEEGVQASDDIRTRNVSEEHVKNPLETFPLFLVEDGPNGHSFNE